MSENSFEIGLPDRQTSLSSGLVTCERLEIKTKQGIIESHWRLATSSDKVSPDGRCAR